MLGDDAMAHDVNDFERREPDEGTAPQSPKRLHSFAQFFKGYMSISTVVIAAMPIPVTALGWIPTYPPHTKILSVLAPVFCFLTLGYVFYRRHGLARAMFPDKILGANATEDS